MGGTLRVDPDALRDAARAQTDVGAAVSGLGVGTSMAGAGTGVSGLASAGGCEFVGSVVDTALGTVGDELTVHSEKLLRAADLYQQGDERGGQRISRLIR
ncbi:type VII secretion target [Mycolicibacterium llatzerense]|uniref:type VII secretion target n=1 Tax=Mycolicibacterium llatzerense TaxID=280871 RepID=UPI0009E1E791|nr:type VII secretion target [Mycolicibacterium llatzerense]